MDEDWSIDVKKYDPAADDGVIAAIVRYCGIALRNRDSSLVSFTDPEETGRVRENYLKKKLGLTDPDSVLDAAIAKVGEIMSADTTRNRVTVYYLLAKHFNKLAVFGAVAAAAAPVAAMAAAKAEEPQRRTGVATGKGAWAPLALLLIGGAGILWGIGSCSQQAPAPVPAPAPAPVAAAAPEVPTGAGVVAVMVEGEPMVSVYFDTAKSDIYPNFDARTQDVRAYLAAHPDTHLQISGYNDPRGNAEFNRKLSKARAFAVRDALAKLGVPLNKMDLVKPADTTDNSDSMAQARRVDVTVEDGPVVVVEEAVDAAGDVTETVAEVQPAPGN